MQARGLGGAAGQNLGLSLGEECLFQNIKVHRKKY